MLATLRLTPYLLAAGSSLCGWPDLAALLFLGCHYMHSAFWCSYSTYIICFTRHPGFQTHLSLPLTLLRHVKIMQKAVWMLPGVFLGQSMCLISKASKLSFLSLIWKSLTLLDASYSVNWRVILKTLIIYTVFILFIMFLLC